MNKQFHHAKWAMMAIFAAVIVAHLVSIYSFYLYDDAFITFRYARNLAEGHDFVYNIGERVQGISTPLWGLLLAGVHAVGLNLELWSRLLGLLLDVVVLGLVWRYLRARQQTLTALLCVFLFAADPYLVKNATGGMEAALFLLATVGACMLTLRKSYHAAAIVAGLSAFIRPEGLLFAVCLLIFVSIEHRVVPWKSLLVGLAVVAGGIALQYGYYGDFIPQSVRGKMALPHTWEGLWSLVFFPRRDPVQFVLTLTALAGLPCAWKRSPLVRVYSFWCAALVAAWAITGAHLWSWYCVPVWFWKVLVTSVAGGELLARWKGLSSTGRQNLLTYGATALIVISWILLAVTIERDRMETNVYSRILQWSAGKDFRSQRAYAMDFGAFGYYTGMKILDEPGLVWPAALTTYRNDLHAILLGEKPEWAYVTCYDRNLDVMRAPDVAQCYVPVWRVSMSGDTTLNPESFRVSKTWTADFILFKRRDVITR
jgi:arabinofuranosyltransferase